MKGLSLKTSFSKESIPVIVLFFLTFIIKFTLLHQSEFATGMDGYYYGVQVKYLRLEGSLRMPESSPVLYLLTLVSFFFQDPINAIKFSASLLSALFIFPAFFLGSKISEVLNQNAISLNQNTTDIRSAEDYNYGLILAVLASLSLSITYMTVEFLKNLGALLFLYCFYYFILKMISEGSEQKKKSAFLLIIIFAVLAFFSHRTAAIAVIITLFSITVLWKMNLRYIIISIPGIFLFISLFIALRKMGILSGGLHITDLLRFDSVFDWRVNIPLFSESFRSLMKNILWLEISLYFFVPYFSLAAFLWLKEKSPFLLSLNIFLLLLNHPFWSLDTMGMGFRILLFGTTLSPILLVASFKLIMEKLHQKGFFQVAIISLQKRLHGASELIKRNTGKAGRGALVSSMIMLSLVACIQLVSSRMLYNPRFDPPYGIYRKIISRIDLPKDSLLICHKGLNLFYTYETGKDALPFIPEYKIPVTKLWRLSYFVGYETYKKFIPSLVRTGQVKEVLYPYDLIREDAWKTFLRKIPGNLLMSYTNPRNPSEMRPLFLRVHHSFNDEK